MKKILTQPAFTLAEVLITLAIIGVVAAMTIPTLTASYRKQVLETRIKKFYSTLGQSYNMNISEQGTFSTSMYAVDDPDAALEYFNTYYKPYLKTIDVEKKTKGVSVGFPDGSGMYIRQMLDQSPAILVFCVNYKECKTNDIERNSSSGRPVSNGKTTFVFKMSGATDISPGRTALRNYCNTCKTSVDMCYWCAALLNVDGWEIKDDYPIKI